MTAINLVFSPGFYGIEVSIPEGYSLQCPDLFWGIVQSKPGVHQVIAERVEGFTILCDDRKQPSHYMRVIQEAAREAGFFRGNKSCSVQEALRSSPATPIRLPA